MPYDLSVETRVNSYTQSRQSAPETVALPDGGYITVWSGAGPTDEGYGIWLQRFDASGSRVGGEVLVNTTTLYSQRGPDVTLLASGGYAVTWNSSVPGGQPGDPAALGVFVQTFGPTGARVGGETQVSPSGSAYQVTALTDGGYVVTWTQSADYPWSGVSAQRYDAAGRTQGQPFVLDRDRDATSASVAPTDTGFIAVWRADNENARMIAIQAFDQGGARLGETFRIPRDIEQTAPQVVRLAEGGFALVWVEAAGLYAQILADDGRPTGDRLLVQAAPNGAQLLHTVVATPDGGFTVAWEQFSGPNPGLIAFSSFAADGNRNGETVTVRTTNGTPGEPPSLAVLASGDLVLNYARYVGDVVNFYDVFQIRLVSIPDTAIIGTAGADSLVGTAQPDLILGREGNDTINGRGGNDRIDGGAGIDTLQLEGLATAYSVQRTADGYRLTGFGQTDIVTNIERLSFDGGRTSLTFAEFEQQAFDPFAYMVANPDIYAAFGPNGAAAARNHYFTFGVNERRDPGTFDVLAYVASNPDLARAFGTNVGAATQHYLTFGRNEGRATANFDGLSYAATHRDLALAFGTDTDAAARHYINFGLAEGRATTGFNALLYAASNPDLARTIGLDATAATLDYLTSGARAGRPTASFDPLAYAAANSDLARAFGTDPASAVTHYLAFGVYEGRPVSGFDSVGYLLTHRDLAGLGAAGARTHWLQFGADEGRIGDAAFGRDQSAHALTGSVTGTLEQATDRDWFQTSLTGGSRITIGLTGTANGVELYDALGNRLASVPGQAANVFDVPISASYYVVVFGATGSYSVSTGPSATTALISPDAGPMAEIDGLVPQVNPDLLSDAVEVVIDFRPADDAFVLPVGEDLSPLALPETSLDDTSLIVIGWRESPTGDQMRVVSADDPNGIDDAVWHRPAPEDGWMMQ